MPRARALVIRVEDRPGMLGEISVALGEKDVNLRGISAGNEGGRGVVRLVVDKPAAARKVLAARGWGPVEEQEVLEVELRDRPGALGEVTTRLGQAGINIDCVFVGVGTARVAKVYLGVSDLKAALRALR